MDHRVVYVEPGASASVGEAVRDAGLAVEPVESLAECLDALDRADCIVAAEAFADGTCVELCRRVRRRRPDLPIVVYPDDGSEALAGEAIAAGADGYVPREQGVETLLDRIDGVLDDGPNDAADGTPPEGVGDGSVADRPAAFGTAGAGAGGSTGELRGADAVDRLGLLVEQSPFAIIEWSRDHLVRDWNPAATELFGYEREEAVGRSAIDLIVPRDERADLGTFWSRLVEDDDGTARRHVNDNVRRDGTRITCEWLNTPLVDEEGEVAGILSFARDISDEIERAEALEALQETTNELMRAESMEAVAEVVIDATENVIEQPMAGIRLYDDESGRLEMESTTTLFETHADEPVPLEPGEGPIWDAYESGERLVADDPAGMVPFEFDLELENAVVNPLGDHGTYTVAGTSGDELDASDNNLIDVLATTAEAALDRAKRERELERAKTVIETVGDCVYSVDLEGRFVTVNDTLTTVTGYDRDELLGEHVSAVFTDESLERGRTEIERLVSAEEDYVATYDLTLVTADGDRIPCEVNSTLLRTDGEVTGTVGIVRDVSDRERMERELVDRKAKIEGLHEVASRLDDCDSSDAVFELTVEAAETVLNFDVCVVDRIDGEYLEKRAISSTLDETNYSERMHVDEGIAGKTYRTGRSHLVDDVYESEDAAPASDSYRSVLSVPIGEHGVFQTVSTEPNAFDRADRELAELLVSHVTDALDRLQFQAQLKAERDRFAALFENVPDAVISVRHRDDEPIVEDVNPAFERIFGYEGNELLGEPLDEYVVPAERREEAERLNRRGERGEIVEAEVKRRTADGLRDFMVRTVPIDAEAAEPRLFSLYTDITEQKQRQKRVEILNRVLRHDLRNGMNIIGGCAEMLADAIDDESADRYADVIRERIDELVGLAEKTRVVERTIERNAATSGPVALDEIVEYAITRLEREYPDAAIETAVPPGTFVAGDDLLETAVFHVLENAVEHNDADEPRVRVELSDSGDDLLALSIVDNGPGIPVEERELLEEEREITQLRHTSGLGLWLVNWVVTQSGGKLAFADNEPRGAVVTLELPKASAVSAASIEDGAAASD